MTKHGKRPAKASPAHLACSIAHGGHPVHITHQEAVRVLERGFLHVTRNDMAPHLMRIAEESAHTFPGYGGGDERLPAGWAYCLGTGFDGQGRGAFLLRPVALTEAEDLAAALSPIAGIASRAGSNAMVRGQANALHQMVGETAAQRAARDLAVHNPDDLGGFAQGTTTQGLLDCFGAQ